jgi:hypothetical protein
MYLTSQIEETVVLESIVSVRKTQCSVTLISGVVNLK